MKMKTTKYDTVFISCTGYPVCKNSMNMPKGISNLQMMNNNCPKCLNFFKREVKMFRLTFERDLINESMAESLPDEGNTSGVFCVF